MKIKRFFRNNKVKKQNNKGMTMVTVIVAIGFVAALVSILLMTTLVNFKMKTINQRGKDSFYSAEQVLDEINVGLQRVVSESLSSTYVEIMESNSSMTNDEKLEKLKTEYYETIWSVLEADGMGHKYYSVDTLESMLKESTRWHSIDETKGESTQADKDGNKGYGAIITAVYVDEAGNESELSKYGNMITYSSGGIVLKNVRVYYKDAKGFVSVIQTDIKLNYPSFSFAKNSALSDITEYAFIADAGAVVEKGKSLDIDGNVYANNFVGEGGNAIKLSDEKTAIFKYDFDIRDGGSLITGEKNEIWARNIKLKSSDVNFNGDCYLANDLTMMGVGCDAKFAGTYIGYGNDQKNADYSSAILVNGKNTTIDMKKLSVFSLYGHAFIDTDSLLEKNKSDKPETSMTAREKAQERFKDLARVNPKLGEKEVKYDDVYMGQSVAIKTDQMYYLVPPEAIGIDETTGKTICINQNNPLTKEEHQRIQDAIDEGKDVTFVSDSVPISGLGGISLNGFLDYKNNKPAYYEHQVRVDENETLYYYYMVFQPTYYMADGNVATDAQIQAMAYASNDGGESKANSYFALYYSSNKAYADKFNKFYLDSASYSNMANFVTAGNIYETGLDEKNEKEYRRNNSTQENSSYMLDGRKQQYKDQFEGLCYNLSRSSSKRATTFGSIEEELKEGQGRNGKKCLEQTVFENVVGTEANPAIDAVKDFVKNCDGTAYKEDPSDNLSVSKVAMSVNFEGEYIDPENPIKKTKNCAVVIDGNYTYGAGEKNKGVHLIIATGDVTISDDFEGLVLCDGELTVTGSVKMTASPELVSQGLLYAYEMEVNGEKVGVSIASIMGDSGADFLYTSVSDKEKLSKSTLAGLVTYENWKKE